MRVALFGGTGFVGSYLVEALVQAGITPVVLVRAGAEQKLPRRDRCEVISGEVGNMGAVTSVLSEADAVVYNIGILRESTARGDTFEELHYKAPRRIVDAAQQLGIRRFLLMSANGVRPDGTAYQRTKFLAEEYLQATDLDWTIFRPSVIFGDPRGRMEFATQLRRDIIDSSLPAPLFYPGMLPAAAGASCMSPVHVEDVAQAFVRALRWQTGSKQTLHLGGPDERSWREILETVAAVAGRRKRMLPVPALGLSTAAALFDRFDAFPVTRDQLQMLLEGNTCSPADLARLGIEPRAFDRKHLGYLNGPNTGGESWLESAA